MLATQCGRGRVWARPTCIPSMPTVNNGILAHPGPLTPGVPTHWTACPPFPPRSYSSAPAEGRKEPPPVIDDCGSLQLQEPSGLLSAADLVGESLWVLKWIRPVSSCS